VIGSGTRAVSAPLVDTHTHLTDRKYEADLDAVFDRARDAGVIAFVVVGYDLPSSEASVALAGRRDDVWAAVGIHPHNARQSNRALMRQVEQLSREPRVVAIGECGLDFYRNLSPRHVQRLAFEAQLGMATERDLPVIVHSRDALPETFAILAACGEPRRGVMHCFDGGAGDAARTVALGLHVSCAGPITYRRDRTLADAIATVPDDRLVVETDCPYLGPEGHRGERNEPAHVRLVAEAVAHARGVRFEEMAHRTSANALRLFSLPAHPSVVTG
jgi:TatD DNase family protein